MEISEFCCNDASELPQTDFQELFLFLLTAILDDLHPFIELNLELYLKSL